MTHLIPDIISSSKIVVGAIITATALALGVYDTARDAASMAAENKEVNKTQTQAMLGLQNNAAFQQVQLDYISKVVGKLAEKQGIIVPEVPKRISK